MTRERERIDSGTGRPNRSSLKRNSLSYAEVLAQSVAVIRPSTVPAAILGLVFVSAGKGTWLSFLLALIGLIFVGVNINQFARRSASPGSLYTYIVKGLGADDRRTQRWALSLAYILTGMSTLCGFAVIAGALLAQVGLHIHVLLLFAVGTAAAFFIAYKDIQLSARTMLVLEGIALIAILALGFVIWSHKGFAIDMTQLRLSGASPGHVLAGIVLVVFGFSGFESSTSLGEEAKDPLRTIPRSIIQSVIASGLIFIFMAYVIILGFEGAPASLQNTEAPLSYLANRIGWGFLGTIVNIGVLLSFLSCTLASINSTARIIFSMARHGLFFDSLGEAHAENRTPYIALGISALITFLIPTAVYLFGVGAYDAQGDLGTLSSFGFLVVYILISIAAPVYLRSLGKPIKLASLYALVGTAFMVFPFLGTVGIPGSALFPPPSYPNNLLLWIFVAYMAIGLVWLLWQRARRPKMISVMQHAIEEVDLQLSDGSNATKPANVL